MRRFLNAARPPPDLPCPPPERADGTQKLARVFWDAGSRPGRLCECHIMIIFAQKMQGLSTAHKSQVSRRHHTAHTTSEPHNAKNGRQLLRPSSDLSSGVAAGGRFDARQKIETNHERQRALHPVSTPHARHSAHAALHSPALTLRPAHARTVQEPISASCTRIAVPTAPTC